MRDTKFTLRSLFKLVLTVGNISLFLVLGGLIRIFVWNTQKRVTLQSQLLSKICEWQLSILDISVELRDWTEGYDFSRPYMLASNHQGYIDVLALSYLFSARFITSIEVKRTPILGSICRAGGSLFVERRKKMQLKTEIRNLATEIQHGPRICIFPEATSSDGRNLLPFRSSLLAAPLIANVDLLPVCIEFLEIDSESFGDQNRDRVCYYGDMTFVPHLMGLLNCRDIRMRVTALRPITPQEVDNRQKIGEVAHERLTQTFSKEKELHHAHFS